MGAVIVGDRLVVLLELAVAEEAVVDSHLIHRTQPHLEICWWLVVQVMMVVMLMMMVVVLKMIVAMFMMMLTMK